MIETVYIELPFEKITYLNRPEFHKEEKEFINLLKEYFTFSNFRKIKVNFENFQNNSIIDNSDLIVWGQLK